MNKILVILPTYNEVINLPILVTQILSLGIDGLEILIVDDESPDGTGEVAEQLSSQYSGRIHALHRVNVQRGLGLAYAVGFKYALDTEANYIIGMDADLSHSPLHIPTMLERIPYCDMVVGSRYVSGGGVDSEWGIQRKLLSQGAQLYVRWLLGIKTRDVTGAFRCYTQQTLQRLRFDLMNLAGYSFLIEIILQAEKLGLQVQEIPITFHVRNSGDSKVTFNIILDALRRVTAIRYNRNNLGLSNRWNFISEKRLTDIQPGTQTKDK